MTTRPQDLEALVERLDNTRLEKRLALALIQLRKTREALGVR